MGNETKERQFLDACIKGDTRIALALEKEGVELNVADKNGESALMFAVKAGKNDLIKRMILSGRANVNAKDKSGRTALMLASAMGNVEIVAFLVQHGADINAKDNDGRTAIVMAIDKKVIRILEGPRRRLWVSSNVGSVYQVAFSPDGEYAVAGLSNGFIICYRVSDGATISTMSISGEVQSIVVSPDSQSILAGGVIYGHTDAQGNVTSEPIFELNYFNLADGTRHYIVSQTGTQIQYKTLNGSCTDSQFKSSAYKAIYGLAITPDGQYAYAYDTCHNYLHCFDLTNCSWVRAIKPPQSYMGHLKFTSDCQNVLSSGKDVHGNWSFMYWNSQDGSCSRSFPQAGNELAQSLSVSEDFQLAVDGTAAGNVWCWKTTDGSVTRQIHAHPGVVLAALSKDGKFVLSQGQDKTIKYWNVSTGVCIVSFSVQNAIYGPVEISPDGKYGISGNGGNMECWKLFQDANIQMWRD